MPSIVVLGIGLQGRAAVHDLTTTWPDVRVWALDRDREEVRARLHGLAGPRVVPVGLDAADLPAFLAEERPDAVLFLASPPLQDAAAVACVEAGVHFVSTNYARDLGRLDPLARERGLAVLPEMGLDPGLDHLLARLALDALGAEAVLGLDSYGGGLPEARASDNPLRYKVTWSLEGVLAAYHRPARRLVDGEVREVSPGSIFAPENVHLVDIPQEGTFEAYPNGDAPSFRDTYGLGPGLRDMGRYTLRWPGHCAFWRVASGLGLLEDGPRAFLSRHLEPRLQFGPQERDLVILRVRAWTRDREVVLHLLDRRDLQTGLFAMNRTVGYTAARAVRWILDGRIAARGVLHPFRHVPARPFLEELQGWGLEVRA